MSADDKEDTTHEEIPKLFRPLRVFCHILGAADKNISTMHRWGVLELGGVRVVVVVLFSWVPARRERTGPGARPGACPFLYILKMQRFLHRGERTSRHPSSLTRRESTRQRSADMTRTRPRSPQHTTSLVGVPRSHN